MTSPNHDDHTAHRAEFDAVEHTGDSARCDALACGCTDATSPQADDTAVAEPSSVAPPRRRAAVDLLELDDRWEAHLDLPGVRLEDVELLVDRGILRVTATRRRAVPDGATVLRREIVDATWDERFRLGEDVDRERIGATLTEGVLHLTLPRRDAARPRRIDVRTG